MRAVGVEFPVFTNQGGKGALLRQIVTDYDPSVTVFVDDLGHNHSSVEEHAPEVWRLHMVGEPRLPRGSPASPRRTPALTTGQRRASGYSNDLKEAFPMAIELTPLKTINPEAKAVKAVETPEQRLSGRWASSCPRRCSADCALCADC